MNLTQALSLLFAAIAAGILYYFVYMNQPADSIKSDQEKKNIAYVAVTTKDLTPGEVILEQQLKWVEWPQNLITPDNFTKDKDKIEELVGYVVMEKIAPMQPVTRKNIKSKKSTNAISLLLPSDKKAFTLFAKNFANLDAQLAVGDYVDLVGVKPPNDKVSNSIILRALKIISMDSVLAEPVIDPTKKVIIQSAPASISFEVDEQQAIQLAELAQSSPIYINHTSAFDKNKDLPVANLNEPDSQQDNPKINIIRGDTGG